VTTPSLIDLATGLWLGFLGACIGSFLNVVAYRMPRGESVIWQPSHCPRCNHPIRAQDNVPVLGWLWLKGKCRDCAGAISPRYAVVEFLMGAAFLGLAYADLFRAVPLEAGTPVGALHTVWFPRWDLLRVFAFHGLLLSWLMSLVLIALDRQRIPIKLLACAALLLIAAIALDRPIAEMVGVVGCLVVAVVYNARCAA
jgi:leader peptidase (prepilin peptidase)/N-methyltransferase